MTQDDQGCVSSAAGPLNKAEPSANEPASNQTVRETMVTARVGQPAPDFEATALHNGAFTNIRLSRYLGKWVVLCFYPGDFTFV